MIGQLKGLCTQFPFQCTLMLIAALFQNKFGYTKVTSLHSDEHCGRKRTL